jgi:hypothetical protein
VPLSPVSPFPCRSREQVTMNSEKPKSCLNSKLILEIINPSEGLYKRIPARCKSWSCPYCGPVNSRNLGKLLGEVLESYLDEHRPSGRKFRYTLKLASLTVPGEDFRQSHTPFEAQKLIRKALNLLLKKLRFNYGLEEYAWFIETKNGWPHVHLLLLGTQIVSLGIMRFINDAWLCLGMGRSEVGMVKFPNRAALYLTKYVSKFESKESASGCHLWGMSKKLRSRVSESRKLASINYTVLKVFRKNEDGTCGKLLWEIGSEVSLKRSLEDEHLEELLDFFDSKINKKGVQAYFWEDSRWSDVE